MSGVDVRACLAIETAAGRLEVLLPVKGREPVRVRLLTSGPVAQMDLDQSDMRRLAEDIGRHLWAVQAGGAADRMVDAADRVALAAQAAQTLPLSIREDVRDA